MNTLARRNFLKTTSGLLLFAATGSGFDIRKKKPPLAFSTLGCPDWSFEKIVNFAAENDYRGIEIRGLQRQMDLPKCPEFSDGRIRDTIQLLKSKQINVINLGASTALHHSNPADRKKHLDEARQFIDLANKLDCPYVRVFPNNFPPNQDRSATIDLIAKGLVELGDYAKGTGVTVLMETHGEVVKSDDILTIMKAAEHEKVALIWDIVNMWVVTKEKPSEVYDKLKKYIRHVHLKDLAPVNGKDQYRLLGEGTTPVFEGIDLLYNDGYKGYYSFEWEKLWHPEIPEPEIALAAFPVTMRKHFEKA